MALIHDLVTHALNIKYTELPEAVIDCVKKSTLDTVAVAIAGSSAEGMEALVKVARELGGREDSTLMVYGGKLPVTHAALANCTMARARDLDDVHEKASMHVNATIIPAALAICEYSKNAKKQLISGEDFITAAALGADFLPRVRMAGPGGAEEGGWSGETPAPLSVALMGSKLLGFDQETTLNALGIAYAQCATNIQAHQEGALTVRLQQGLGGMAGILGLLLAQDGITGVHDVLEGKYGYFSLYMRGIFNPEVLMEGLGERFEGCNVSIKPYPSCKYTHTAIHGALVLARLNAFKWNDVDKVTLLVSPHGYTLCGGENKKVPQSVPEAQFSYYYTVATALVKGRVFLEDFTPQAIKNRDILGLAQKVQVKLGPQENAAQVASFSVKIIIETKQGGYYEKKVESVRGHPDDPMTCAELTQKLIECATFASRPIPLQDLEMFSQKVQDLQKIKDVAEILTFIA